MATLRRLSTQLERRVTYLELSPTGRTTSRQLRDLAEVATTTFVDALGPARASQIAEAMAELVR